MDHSTTDWEIRVKRLLNERELIAKQALAHQVLYFLETKPVSWVKGYLERLLNPTEGTMNPPTLAPRSLT
jgi:hypothetical protein